MGQVKVAGFSISLDGFGAGPEQSLQNPLGKRGSELHGWFTGTKSFKAMFGAEGGSEGADNDYAHRAMDGFGAFILGRNMFAHSRGAWTDDGWKGWWDENPPYHAPTFILTHYPRDPIVMEGGTTFHFVTEGIYAALERARAVVGDKDIKIGGGVETVRQYFEAGLIDEAHFAISPVMLGQGEAMFEGMNLPALGYGVIESMATERATHVTLGRQAATTESPVVNITISIDVPSIEEGLAFFGEVFGFVETARPHPGYAMLTSGEATIGLVAKPAGSSPAVGSSDVRRYERHWTPVHVDFRVDNFEATLERAREKGAKTEQVHRVAGYPPVAFCSDPFGHGFCIVGMKKL